MLQAVLDCVTVHVLKHVPVVAVNVKVLVKDAGAVPVVVMHARLTVPADVMDAVDAVVAVTVAVGAVMLVPVDVEMHARVVAIPAMDHVPVTVKIHLLKLNRKSR